MKRALLACIAGAALAAAGGASAGVEVVIACGSQGDDQSACQAGAEAWAKSTGNAVRLVAVPTDSSQQLTQYQQLFAARSSDVDVFRLDIVWPGMVAGHMVDLRPHVTGEELGRHFAPIVQALTVDGKLVALPWFTDAGLLYYRKDLLEKHGQKVPSTWQELAATAKLVMERERAAGNRRMVGFVFQGKAYEGLTCNALEWIDAFGGGTVVADDGTVTADDPRAVAAIAFAASMVGNAAPMGVLNYDEEAARGAFQSGQAVFMRNWPYAWAKAQAGDSLIKDKVGVMALPPGGPGGKRTGTLGGWNLGVSRYSTKQEAAISLVKYLTGPEEQKRRAIAYAANPTIASLYQDPDVLKANPFMGKLSETFASAVARPSKKTGRSYSRVSAELQTAVHAVLAGSAEAGPMMHALAGKLEKLRRGGKW